MRSVLADLKSDYHTSASTQALEKLDRLESEATPAKDASSMPESQRVEELKRQLKAAKQAVKILRQDKEKTHNKLERLDALLVKERASLRDVLQAARKAFADLKREKETMRNKLSSERKKHKDLLAASREETKTAEEAIVRLQGVIRDMEKREADMELGTMPEEARGAILKERENLSSALATAAQMHAEDAEELHAIDEEMQRLFAELVQSADDMASELVQVQRGERQAELSNENTKARVAEVTEKAKGDRERLSASLEKKHAETLRLRAMLENAGLDPGPVDEEDPIDMEGIDFGSEHDSPGPSLADELGELGA